MDELGQPTEVTKPVGLSQAVDKNPRKQAPNPGAPSVGRLWGLLALNPLLWAPNSRCSASDRKNRSLFYHYPRYIYTPSRAVGRAAGVGVGGHSRPRRASGFRKPRLQAVRAAPRGVSPPIPALSAPDVRARLPTGPKPPRPLQTCSSAPHGCRGSSGLSPKERAPRSDGWAWVVWPAARRAGSLGRWAGAEPGGGGVRGLGGSGAGAGSPERGCAAELQGRTVGFEPRLRHLAALPSGGGRLLVPAVGLRAREHPPPRRWRASRSRWHCPLGPLYFPIKRRPKAAV